MAPTPVVNHFSAIVVRMDKHTGTVLKWVGIGFAVAIAIIIILSYLAVYCYGIRQINREYDQTWREIERQEGIEMERRERLERYNAQLTASCARISQRRQDELDDLEAQGINPYGDLPLPPFSPPKPASSQDCTPQPGQASKPVQTSQLGNAYIPPSQRLKLKLGLDTDRRKVPGDVPGSASQPGNSHVTADERLSRPRVQLDSNRRRVPGDVPESVDITKGRTLAERRGRAPLPPSTPRSKPSGYGRGITR